MFLSFYRLKNFLRKKETSAWSDKEVTKKNNICCAKGESIADHLYNNQKVKKILLKVARTSTIRQHPVGLKPWFIKSCSKLESQIWRVALEEYQVSLLSHSPVWFITFMILAKVTKLGLKILQRFWLNLVQTKEIYFLKQVTHSAMKS